MSLYFDSSIVRYSLFLIEYLKVPLETFFSRRYLPLTENLSLLEVNRHLSTAHGSRSLLTAAAPMTHPVPCQFFSRAHKYARASDQTFLSYDLQPLLSCSSLFRSFLVD